MSNNPYLDLLDRQPDATNTAQPAAAGPNPYIAAADNYDALMAAHGEAQRVRANAAVSLGMNQNPDSYAAARRAAQLLGAPVGVAEAVPEQVQREARMRQVQQDSAAVPALGRAYTDADFARLAHDDSGVLGLFGTLADSFRRGVPSLKQNASATAMRANANGLAQMDAAEGLLRAGKTGLTLDQDPLGIEYMTPEQRATLRGSFQQAAGSNAATIATAQAAKAVLPAPPVVSDVMRAKGFGEAISAFMQDPVRFVAAVGPESLVQSAPGIAAAVVMPGGAAAKAATFGVGSFGVDYGSSLLEALGREGVDMSDPAALQRAAANGPLMRRAAAQAMAHAAVVGTVDGLSGGVASRSMLPAKVLARAPVARELANLAVQTPLQGALGGLGEAGGQLAAGQDLDPGAILAEIVGEAFTAPAEVAGIAGGQVRERMAQAKKAKADAEQLAKVMQAAEQSKLRERAPDAFARYAAEATEGAEIYIDAKAFAQSMPEADLAKLVEAVPAIGEQLTEAAAVGGDIVIRVADLATHLAGTPAAEQLLPLMRTAPEAMSATEAEAFNQDEALRTEVTRLADEQPSMQATEPAADGAPAAQGVQDVQAQALDLVRGAVMQQLGEANRFTPAVNKSYADLIVSFVAATAERAGIPVADLWQQFAPTIVAEFADDPATLDQGGQAGQLLGSDPPQLAQGARGSFSPSTRTIALLERADLSTFLHEAGHYFLEVHTALAERADASPAIKADLQALFDWFGVPDLAAWQAMDIEQRRPHHEKFARGFEAYLLEGNAPAPELQSVFARFRSWLLRVYQHLAALNVQLTDEVRNVMDRMLASDAQIREAEYARNLRPMFESAAAAGMTPEEFAAYQAQGQGATSQAIAELQARSLRDLRMLTNAKARAVKKANASAKAKRAAIEAEVRAEVEAQPIYAAWRDLARGKTADGSPVKLSLSDLKASFPELADRIPKGMANDKPAALPVEMVADAYGLSSADELVKLLATLDPPETVIEGMTDQRMLERHGELADERAVEQVASAAVVNDMRTRVLATEMAVLAKAVGSTPVLTRAARQFAEASTAGKKVRELRPAKHAAAESRAARAAEAAFKAGQVAEAAAKKREQLLQHVLAKTTTAALAEVDKAIDYLSKFDNETTRKAIGPDYADQIDQLLERFDLRTSQSLRAIDKRKSLAAWVEQQEQLGLSPEIDERLLAEAQRKSYRDMTVEELRGLVDTVKNIEHLGRLKQRLLTVQDQRAFDAIVSEASDSIVKHGGKAKPVELEGRRGVLPWLQGVAASHRKLSSLARQMDGGKDNGPMYRLLVRGMNDAGTREAVMTEKATEALVRIYKPVLAMKGGLTGAKVYIPEIRASLSRGGRLAAALNWGNDVNRQRLMDGDNWSPEQVHAILRTLSPAELHFVNQVHEFVDSFWPDVKAKQLRVSGVVEDKVEADPWTATASDGSTVQMRGGYYPLKYDADRSARAESLEAAETAKDMMRGAFTRATTRRGHTKARSDVVKRPVRKDLNVLTEHVTQVVHDLAWHEWIIDANRLISAKPIDQAIRAHYGPDVVQTIKDDLMGIATADVVPQTKVDAALQTLRANISRSTMGYSFTTALLQPFGLTQSVARIGAGPVLRGVARWGGDALRFESSLAWIGEKSEFMRLRNKTFNRELHEISSRVLGKSKAGQIYDASLFYLARKMQMIADVPTWIGRYEQALAQGFDDAAAVALADEAVLGSQGGGQIKDMAEVQRRHPFLTQFYSYFATTLNLTIEKTAATNFRDPKAVAGWLADMALLAAIPAIVPALLTDLLRGTDDEDKMAKKLAQWQAAYLLGMAVGARELSGAVSGYSYAGPPVGRIVSDVGKAGQQVAQGEVDEPAVWAAVRLMGSAFGIPTVQATRSYEGWQAWSEGRAPATAVLFGPPEKQ
jgi:hypothetical protein